MALRYAARKSLNRRATSSHMPEGANNPSPARSASIVATTAALGAAAATAAASDGDGGPPARNRLTNCLAAWATPPAARELQRCQPQMRVRGVPPSQPGGHHSNSNFIRNGNFNGKFKFNGKFNGNLNGNCNRKFKGNFNGKFNGNFNRKFNGNCNGNCTFNLNDNSSDSCSGFSNKRRCEGGVGVKGAAHGAASGLGRETWGGGGGRVLLAMSAAASDESGQDIWRNSVLRYAGYANEVGESFRFIAPKLVAPSYAVSFGYVCGDTADKAYKEYSQGKGLAAAGKMGFDVLLWQSLASVAVPGLTINLAVKGVTAAMASDQAVRLLSKVARKWTPTALGLGVIPFIVHPIDEAVTWAMDETVRKWLHSETDEVSRD